LDTLLQTGVKSIRPPIRVLNTRGDAVLAFVAADDFLQPQSLLEAIEMIYYDLISVTRIDEIPGRVGEGSLIRIMYDEPLEGDKDELESLFREAAQDALRRLVALLEQAQV
jgi:hypothetical protein